jgi:valyl-tRNA synthetase
VIPFLDILPFLVQVDAFIKMHDDGLIYRANRVIHWCPQLQTVISDIEVDPVEYSGAKEVKMRVPLSKDAFGETKGYTKVEFGVIHTIRYNIVHAADGSHHSFVEVGTTRPETIPGDVALAVHSTDTRYMHLHGGGAAFKAVHPFTKELLPIVVDDELVDPEMGTGVVKVTPGHDADDFACGKRHALPEILIMDDHGFMNAHAGEHFEGLHRWEARAAVIAELAQLDLYAGKKDNPMSVPTCSRSQDVLEPLAKPQWFIACEAMARTSLDLVLNGDVSISQEESKKLWVHTMSNHQDWCISRQLWWGHRIPAFRVLPPGSFAADNPASTPDAGNTPPRH